MPAHEQDENFRSKAKIKLLNLYRAKPDKVKMYAEPKLPARIEPDRKWFGNTRVLAQKELETLRTELEEQQKNKDPYTIVINQRKLPMQLISDATASENKVKILAVEPFEVSNTLKNAVGNNGTQKTAKKAKISGL
jgi:nuclear GTP-binding protein